MTIGSRALNFIDENRTFRRELMRSTNIRKLKIRSIGDTTKDGWIIALTCPNTKTTLSVEPPELAQNEYINWRQAVQHCDRYKDYDGFKNVFIGDETQLRAVYNQFAGTILNEKTQFCIKSNDPPNPRFWFSRPHAWGDTQQAPVMNFHEGWSQNGWVSWHPKTKREALVRILRYEPNIVILDSNPAKSTLREYHP